MFKFDRPSESCNLTDTCLEISMHKKNRLLITLDVKPKITTCRSSKVFFQIVNSNCWTHLARISDRRSDEVHEDDGDSEW